MNGTEGPAYSASLDNVELCLVVSGSVPEKPTDGLEHCIKSGLISRNDAGEIQDPFAPAGLKELTAVKTDTGENVLFARAWMAPNFMANTNLADVPPFYAVAIAPTDKIEKKGSQSVQALFKRTSVGQKIQLEAACNAASDQKLLAFEESFKLDVQEFLQEAVKRSKSTSQAGATTSTVTEDTLFESLKEAFAATGDSAPFVDIVISRSLGTTFRAGFEGAYDLKLGGKTIKGAALTEPKSNSEKSATSKIDLAGTTLEKNSVLELKINGSILHQCDKSNSVSRLVTLKPGLPRVVWFQKAKQ